MEGIDNIKHKDYHYTGTYRGTVVYNNDPDVKGKVKIFVHGVYPDEYFTKHEYLPWAEPAMPLFGGAWKNEDPDSHGNHLNNEVGWCSAPHAGNAPDQGAQVFLFFEHGDINYPVYFAAAQAGKGWFSEHENQHVFRSDNVHVRIDQNTADPRSTTKFDSYNQKNSLLSITDGTKKQTETRVDIQIQAKDMVAINLQISGDVNMRQIGDMYIEQQGNRHQTLIGNRYVKHVGNTYIEHEGIYISRQTGAYNQQYVQANKITDIVGNVTEKIYGNEYKEIQGTRSLNVGYAYTLFVGRKFNITVTEDMSTQVMKNYNLNVVQGVDIDVARNCALDIGRFNETNTGTLQITTANDIQLISKQGGISLQTLGQFDLLNEAGAITSDGYRNLGLKGNITIKSHMGNIGLETVGDSGFEKECMIIPWNPVFLGNVQLMSMIIQDFDPTKMLFNNNIFQLGDIGSMLNFITSLPMMGMYDGLPTILPCRMIAQNPNKEPVEADKWVGGIDKDTNKPTLGESRKFSKAEDDWRKVTNDAYWKVLGKVVGNIDIRSWSGDINVITEGRLGNGGNINIFANDPIGTFADYKGGTVNIKSKAKKTIYNDPRHLFFNSQSIMNRSTILTNGSGGGGKIMKYINVGSQEDNAGGCAACIADYALSLLSGIPISKESLNMYAMGIKMHEFNHAIQPNTLTYEPIRLGPALNGGFGHAYDNGMIDDFCTKNHGNVTIDSDGSFLVDAINKYELNANKLFGNDSYHFEATVEPNWEYGSIFYGNTSYVPEFGFNKGNKVILQQRNGKKYSFSFVHDQYDYVVGGTYVMSKIPNTITDKDIIEYNCTIGNKSVSVNESYNNFWIYTPVKYLYPKVPKIIASIDNKNPLLAPMLSGLPAYTEKYNEKGDYKNITSDNTNQSITKNAMQVITIINDYDQQKNHGYNLNVQEIQLDGAPIAHTVTKNVGLSGLSNITQNFKGMNISQNFEASMTDQETHRALIMTSQTYNSLLYNVDVTAATEVQKYVGVRNISSDMVTWAVSRLNYTQK